MSDEDLLSMCLLLFMAGLDTVAMQLSYSMMHLATHDDDRQRLDGRAVAVPHRHRGISSLLRLRDTRSEGHPRQRLPRLSGQGRSDGLFPDSLGQPLPGRSSSTPTRCSSTGRSTVTSRSEPARTAAWDPIWPARSCRIGLMQWLARIPEFRSAGLAWVSSIHEHGGQIGLDNLPLEWDV